MSIKHALKTALAAALTLLFYRWLVSSDRANETWAVVSAVIVMQSNLGSAFKASSSRVQGTALGALIGALFAWAAGANFVSLAAAVGLTVLACSSLGLSESLRLAGATTVLVILGMKEDSPWGLGWQRFLDVVTGIGVALVTQLVIWPARAGRELRRGLAEALQTSGTFYRT